VSLNLMLDRSSAQMDLEVKRGKLRRTPLVSVDWMMKAHGSPSLRMLMVLGPLHSSRVVTVTSTVFPSRSVRFLLPTSLQPALN